MAENQQFQGFFSYAHLDAEVDPGLVEALTTRLAQRITRKLTNARLTIWRDVKGLQTGQRWDDRIGNAVRESSIFIVLMTPKWFESPYCRKEYEIFKQVEDGIGTGEFVVPILAHHIEKQLPYFDTEQKATYDELNKRQYKKSIATKFLALTSDQREVLIDEIADDVENMIDRLRRGALRAPEIPAQGYGPHFEIGPDGRVTFAPPKALDRQGNHVARLREYHPLMRDLASELVKELGTGNSPHHRLGTRLEAYRKLIDQDLECVNFAKLCAEGVRLANADKAAIAAIAAIDDKLPPIAPTVRADIDTLLEWHGRFIMATIEGIETIAASDRYRRDAQQQADFQAAADSLVKTIINRPDVIDPDVATFVGEAVSEIGTGRKPERSGAMAAGTVTNLVITMIGAATLGGLAATAAASQSPALIAGATAALMVVGEGLKKSKPFVIVASLVTKGLERISETDVAKAYGEISKQLGPLVRFTLNAAPSLRHLANQRESGLNWVNKSLDWLIAPAASQSIQASVHIVQEPDTLVASGTLGFIPGHRFRDFDGAPEMVVVPAGEFMMGSPEGKGDPDEYPQHHVTIANSFAVSVCQVTRGEFAAFVDATNHKIDEAWRNPGFERQDDHPVVNVNWHDAKAYVAWLTERSGGNPYRLLSEAEWEPAQHLRTAPAVRSSPSWRISAEAQRGVRPRFPSFRRTRGACTTCTATSGNGAKTIGTRTMTVIHRRTARSGRVETRLVASCVAVPGVALRRTSARPSAVGTLSTTPISFSVFALPERFSLLSPLDSPLTLRGRGINDSVQKACPAARSMTSSA